jgi:hypothetical protein
MGYELTATGSDDYVRRVGDALTLWAKLFANP